MFKIVGAAFLGAILGLWPTSALADVKLDGAGKTVEVKATFHNPAPPTLPPGPPVPSGGGRSTGGPPQPVVARPGPNGTLCNTGSTTLVKNLFSWLPNVTFLPCAGGAGASAPPPPTPAEAAYAAWHTQVILPDPTLSTNPTRAITGLDTFLTIGGQPSVSWSGSALGIPVRIEVSSAYDIDWGDPRPDGSVANGKATITGTTSPGGPYPNGDLRHQYIERGSATIQVTQRWTANWSAGGESGTLADRLHTESSLVLPIDEIQAVVTG